jgi:signal transduction histidine kinase
VPTPVDAAVAGAFLLIVLAEARFSPAVRDPATFVAVAGATTVALAWRRCFPLAVTAVAVAANLALNPTGELSLLLVLVLVTWTVGSATARPCNVVGLLLVVVPFVAVNLARGLEPSDLAAGLVFFVGPWLVGAAVRGRTARSAEAEARAALREERAAAEAARAVEQERTRIARELHDIVSHSISVVTIQTQAVRRRLRPDQEREAADLAAVEGVARDALTEMRRLLGVLRAQGDGLDLAPQPRLAELDRLVEAASSAAVPVRLEVVGEPVDLPAGLELTAYRIVQEGVTNALRHAGAGRVDVRVVYAADGLHLEVVDDGRGLPRDPAPSPPSGGHGLVGVRERVALYGGEVELGAAPGGGTRLAARLPLDGPA